MLEDLNPTEHTNDGGWDDVVRFIKAQNVKDPDNEQVADGSAVPTVEAKNFVDPERNPEPTIPTTEPEPSGHKKGSKPKFIRHFFARGKR